ncbi:helix-hairpin-helix domain-containing protein [Fulvivirga sedimenti]|uniref:Helix-hairpin-helix domain-containing protein n=1 Tax=Fulvivirga sedimenti TaxID=2879465 RepID=A0A9X1HUB8_9BACT|nr:helix-hairpin-helix domain-containing protein [Fulvivirga sedimenti]MCA6075412.1 helix-hairpin-helix domain-containing protein [Fulvivirga sedimenti]MCA6076589.1 helix-hairpin-helix domain-containing protein [Fulvivirga sedimenti]MCA6077717.1 helix-hairpin-helix domain-containing protein [Fulvivirga sedimenti]
MFRNLKNSLTILAWVIGSLHVHAQAGLLFESALEEGNLPDAMGELPQYLQEATPEHLQMIDILTSKDIEEFIQYRRKFGRIISPYELQAIPGFTREKIRSLLQYFMIPELAFNYETSEGFLSRPESLEFMLLAEKQTARPGIHFRGRMTLDKPGQWKAGLRFDQDPGETWKISPAQGYWGADHINVFFQKQPSGIIERMIIGDFRVHTGQGLIHQGSFQLGKGSNLPLPSAASFITYHGSFSESSGMSGGAITLSKGRWKTSGYISFRRRDASIYNDKTFRSFMNSGDHSDQASQKKRKAVGIISIGHFTEYHGTNGRFGYAINSDRLTHNLAYDRMYKDPLPEGSSFGQASLFGNYRYRNLLMWFEIAANPTGSTAWVSGVSISAGRNLEWILLLRRYQPGYFTFYGKGFSETGSGFSNERGRYLGFRYSIRKKLLLVAYADFYLIPWYSYRHNTAVRGRDGRLDLTYTIHDHMNVRLLSKVEKRDQSPGNSQSLTTYRHQFHWVLKKNLHEMRIRVQYNMRSSLDAEQGWLLSCEWIIDNPRTSWNMRFMYFRTDSYYTREFTFERDVWGSFSLPSYYGKGYRAFLLVRHRFNRSLTGWFRWALTVSSPEKSGYREHELKIQLKYTI